MKALGVAPTVDDYAWRLPYWFINDVLIYESVKAQYEKAMRDEES